MKTVAFFNNKGGVGKTSLVYHLAWMYADLGVPVLAVDLDPQSNLTAAFRTEAELEQLWPDGPHPATIHGVIEPLLSRSGDLRQPQVVAREGGPALLPGDLRLAQFEDLLAEAWPKCTDDKATEAEYGLKITSAFHRAVQLAGRASGAALALIDVGPSLGPINRSALVATDHVVVPVAADLFSYHALRNLGPTLRDWRSGWQSRRKNGAAKGVQLDLPAGAMQPIGYVVMQPVTYASRPVKAYRQWIARMPATYAREVLDLRDPPAEDDPNRLGTLRHYRSLVPLAQQAGKPIFHLTAADGAFGSHADAVRLAAQDFEKLARAIAGRCGVAMRT